MMNTENTEKEFSSLIGDIDGEIIKLSISKDCYLNVFDIKKGDE